jgi:hypothetical protein
MLLCKPKVEVDVLGTMSRHSQQALKLDDSTKQRSDISRKCDAARWICPSEWRLCCVELMNQSHGMLFWIVVRLIGPCVRHGPCMSTRLFSATPRRAEGRQMKRILSLRRGYFFRLYLIFLMIMHFVTILLSPSFFSFLTYFLLCFLLFYSYSPPFPFRRIIPLTSPTSTSVVSSFPWWMSWQPIKSSYPCLTVPVFLTFP